MEPKCAHCSLRAKYDNNPNSFLGKFWHWHIRFCPGWRAYLKTLRAEEQEVIRKKYALKK